MVTLPSFMSVIVHLMYNALTGVLVVIYATTFTTHKIGTVCLKLYEIESFSAKKLWLFFRGIIKKAFAKMRTSIVICSPILLEISIWKIVNEEIVVTIGFDNFKGHE